MPAPHAHAGHGAGRANDSCERCDRAVSMRKRATEVASRDKSEKRARSWASVAAPASAAFGDAVRRAVAATDDWSARKANAPWKKVVASMTDARLDFEDGAALVLAAGGPKSHMRADKWEVAAKAFPNILLPFPKARSCKDPPEAEAYAVLTAAYAAGYEDLKKLLVFWMRPEARFAGNVGRRPDDGAAADTLLPGPGFRCAASVDGPKSQLPGVAPHQLKSFFHGPIALISFAALDVLAGFAECPVLARKMARDRDLLRACADFLYDGSVGVRVSGMNCCRTWIHTCSEMLHDLAFEDSRDVFTSVFDAAARAEAGEFLVHGPMPDPEVPGTLLGELAAVMEGHDDHEENKDVHGTVSRLLQVCDLLQPGKGFVSSRGAARSDVEGCRQFGRNNAYRCFVCGGQAGPGKKLEKCGRCKLAWYCSKTCQVKGYPEHKAVCLAAQAKAKSAKGKGGGGGEVVIGSAA